MITELRIGNFKAFGEAQRVPLKPLTLIFGANSSGKSSIIHSLLLANHGLKTGNWDVRHPRLGPNAVDLGGHPYYVHGHRGNVAVTMRFEASLNTKGLLECLYGTAEEKAPFATLTSFGFALEVARTRAPEDSQNHSRLPAVQAVSLDLNHGPALRFERTGPETFRCCEIHPENPFLRGLLESMLALADETQDVGLRLRDAPAPMPGETGERGRRTFENPPQGFAAERLAMLGSVFSTIMRERRFEWSRAEDPVDHAPSLVEVCGDDQVVPGSSYMEEQIQYHGGLIRLCGSEYGRDLYLLLGDEKVDTRGEVRLDLEPPAQAARINLSELLKVTTLILGRFLDQVSYLGPLREVPSRHPGAEWPTALQANAGGLGAWKEVCEKAQVRETVNRWLGKGWVDTPYSLEVRRLNDPENPLSESLLEPFFRDAAGTHLSHHDLGFGVNQVLPILVQAAALTKRTICVEQPELHLHPALQAELGDVFIESALGEQKNTFLLETHSEHLILRIMRRIRETHAGKPHGVPITNKDVSVLYVEREGPRSIVREMPLNERGELAKAWPGGFFEEGYRELFT